MENYLQATIMAPDKKFQALQRDDGNALLFSIDSNDAFNVTCELNDERAGWKTIALLDDATRRQYPGAPCRDFAVAQRADGSIHMAMVLRESKGGQAIDHLHLAVLALPASGAVAAPAWVEYAYDGADKARPAPNIAGIFLSEASDGEYIVADLVRDPSSPTREIARYFIDPSKYQGHAWHLHDLPVDIEGDKYASVLGRKDGANIDGMYVGGQINGKPQIVYTPLYNELKRDSHPLSDYLSLSASEDIVPDAIATCLNLDNTSDLYACANGVLYRFASTNQRNGAIATLAKRDPQFHGVKDLFALADARKVVIWGRNADNAVFYTSCARAELDNPAAWSIALPILQQVEQLSPFVNRARNANALFTHTGGNDLKIGIKSPNTGTWAWRSVTLAPSDVRQAAKKFTSFTSKIQVHDIEHKPARGVTVAISASAVTAVYINHIYYAVGPVPIHVKADLAGSVTIVEAVSRLTGTRFDVSVVGDASEPMPVNPMHKAFVKATDLHSVEALKNAKIKRYVKDANGTCRIETRNLIKPGVDDAVLGHVASLNKQLANVYANPQQPPLAAALLFGSEGGFVVPADAPRVDAGDLFQFLEARSDHLRLHAHAHPAALAAGESFWDMLVRWFEGAWEFVVKIGEAVYRCVLKVVEDIVSAVRWVFDKIVAAVEDLVEFLQYLFEWDDFKRTKDVIHNVSRLFMAHQLDQIPVFKKGFDEMIESTIKSINHWAGIKDYPGLGTDGSGRISSKAKEEGPDAPGSLLQHHYQGNIHAASGGPTGGVDLPTTLLKALETAMQDEKLTLDNAFHQLRDLMREASGMSVVAILQALTGILADAVLRSAKVVIDALLDIFVAVARQSLALLDSPVHIPVISDILNAIGIPDFSALDVICWIAAVPVTIGYKVAAALAGKEHGAPFPDNAETRLLIQANDFEVLAAAFKGAVPRLRISAPALMVAADGPVTMSDQTAEAVSISLHAVSGICGYVSAFLDSTESLLPEVTVPMLLSGGCVASAVIGGGSRAAANFLVPRYPLEGPLDRYYSLLTTGFFLLNKGVWGLRGLMADPTARANGAKLDAVLVIPALVISCIHFSQLAQKPAGKQRSIAIMDETSFMSTYVSRVLYTLLVNGVFDADEEVKIGVAATMGVFQIVHGSLQFGESAVEWLA
jgi:hypothetical protein